MNHQISDAAGLVWQADRLLTSNKDRTSWTLREWCYYFHDIENPVPSMTTEEIAAATLWLQKKGYPIPTDCPKRPESAFCKKDGGCPAFRPVCLTHGICQMARGMCDLVTDVATCPTCKEQFDSISLRNEESRKEFKISGMCQKCQDEVFGRD